MKKTIFPTLAPVVVCSLILFAQGCGQNSCSSDCDHDHGTPSANAAGHDNCVHEPKYNNVIAEFPGHKYALEVIDDEATGLVTAFLTDAHFDPVSAEAQEVRLNFVIAGSLKTYTLTRIEQTAGKPMTFTLTDMGLATLICEGWQGNATALVEIDGAPYNAKLVKLDGHVHDPDYEHPH